MLSKVRPVVLFLDFNAASEAQNVTNSYSTGYFSTLTFRREFGTSGALQISIDGDSIFAQDGFDQSMFGTNMRRVGFCCFQLILTVFGCSSSWAEAKTAR
jgi:hypothetical protein